MNLLFQELQSIIFVFNCFQLKMKVTTPEISWHERDPIYSVDIQPGNRSVRRLVSGGVDKFVRVSLLLNEYYNILSAINVWDFIILNVLVMWYCHERVC
jgi:hypothetical protein